MTKKLSQDEFDDLVWVDKETYLMFDKYVYI